METDATSSIRPPRMAHFFGSGRKERSGINAHMFSEDISGGIIPYRNNSYSESIVGDESETKRAIALLRSLQDRARARDHELIAGSVRQISRLLTHNGRAVFEILKSDHTQPKFAFSNFTTKRLLRLPTHWLQFVPNNEYENRERRLNIIPASDVWLVEIPASLGGRRGYKSTLRKLARFDRGLSNLVQRGFSRGAQSAEFDFIRYRRESEIYNRRATRLWGWTHRDGTREDWTEFAYFYRYITFRHSQAIFREFLVSELNRVLRRLRVGAVLHMSGLQAPGQILELRSRLCTGDVSFKDAMDFLMKADGQ